MTNRYDEHLVFNVVYFILATESGRIKIGTTGSIASVFQTLQRANGEPLRILATVPGDYHHEAELHSHFHAIRLHREWFRATPELFGYIASAVKQGATFKLPAMVDVPPSKPKTAPRAKLALVPRVQLAAQARSALCSMRLRALCASLDAMGAMPTDDDARLDWMNAITDVLSPWLSQNFVLADVDDAEGAMLRLAAQIDQFPDTAREFARDSIRSSLVDRGYAEAAE